MPLGRALWEHSLELQSTSRDLVEQCRAARAGARLLRVEAQTLRFRHRQLLRARARLVAAGVAVGHPRTQPSPWSRLPWERLEDELTGVLELVA